MLFLQLDLNHLKGHAGGTICRLMLESAFAGLPVQTFRVGRCESA
jgi:hypothetical protein